MKPSIILLTFLHCWLLTSPPHAPADQVHKHAVILKEIRELKNANGALIAKESIYRGGIPGPAQGVILRELQDPKGTFTFSQAGIRITAKVIPMVATRHHQGKLLPALGKWDFQNRASKSYDSAIHVKMAGDLDIVYQSTDMSLGKEDNVLHYGLSGNPHAVSLSKKRLKDALAFSTRSSDIKPILHYQPADDIILIQMELTPEGFFFQPIFDYQVAKQ